MKRLLETALDGLHHLLYGGDEKELSAITTKQKLIELLPWLLLTAFIIFLAANGLFD